MAKIWFLLVLVTMPDAPSVKYNGFLYSSEMECVLAQKDYLTIYESKPQNYKDGLYTNAYCIPFDAFPIEGFNNTSI